MPIYKNNSENIYNIVDINGNSVEVLPGQYITTKSTYTLADFDKVSDYYHYNQTIKITDITIPELTTIDHNIDERTISYIITKITDNVTISHEINGNYVLKNWTLEDPIIPIKQSQNPNDKFTKLVLDGTGTCQITEFSV